MHVFALALLFGLGIMSVARWEERPLHALGDRMKMMISLYPLLEVLIGIGLAWAINFNLWAMWGIGMRAAWLGVTLTGVALGGVAQFFTEILAMFGGLGRKLHDEAETIEHPSLTKAA